MDRPFARIIFPLTTLGLACQNIVKAAEHDVTRIQCDPVSGFRGNLHLRIGTFVESLQEALNGFSKSNLFKGPVLQRYCQILGSDKVELSGVLQHTVYKNLAQKLGN